LAGGMETLMIPYPTTQTLLTKHGNTAAGREKARKEIVAVIRAGADREATAAGRSMKCAGWANAGIALATPRHRGDPDGCRNNGSTCICECHDPIS